MTDLSNLPPEVREELLFVKEYESDAYVVLRDYILRVTAERDALAKRIADAPVGRASLRDNFVQPSALLPLELRGQLVALVKVE